MTLTKDKKTTSANMLPAWVRGKNALVTGSTSGIGLGIVHALAEAGANVMLNGFGDKAEIEKSRKEIENKGVNAYYNGADMTRPDEIRDLIKDAQQKMGSLDILVNNAGIQHVSEIENFPPEKWDAIIAIDLSSSFHTIRHSVPAMKKNGWGRIINIVSAHGLVASPFKAAYVAAKHGMMGLTKTVAIELAEAGITCNAICPGYVFTPLVEGQIADTMQTRGLSKDEVIKDVLLKAQHTKKFSTIEQISQTCLFLCSPAADNITGAPLLMDGGWTAS